MKINISLLNIVNTFSVGDIVKYGREYKDLSYSSCPFDDMPVIIQYTELDKEKFCFNSLQFSQKCG